MYEPVKRATQSPANQPKASQPGSNKPTQSDQKRKLSTDNDLSEEVRVPNLKVSELNQSHKIEENLIKACSPVPQMISSQRAVDLRRKSIVVPKKDKIRFIEELLVISVPDDLKLQIKNSPGAGFFKTLPKLTFTYPNTNITYTPMMQREEQELRRLRVPLRVLRKVLRNQSDPRQLREVPKA